MFVHHLQILKIVGISLKAKTSLPNQLYFYTVLFTIVIGSHIGLLGLVGNKEVNFDTRIQVITYCTGEITCVALGIVMFRGRKQLGSIFKSLHSASLISSYNRVGSFGKMLVQKQIAKENKLVATAYIAYIITMTIPILESLIVRIINRDSMNWSLPFYPMAMVNTTESPQFELAWCLQSLGVLLGGSVFLIVNLIFSSFAAHICIQLKILQKLVISALVSFKNPEKGELVHRDVSWKYTRQIVSEIVLYHNTTIRLSKNFENVYNNVMLVQQLGVILALCGLMEHISSLDSSGFQYVADISLFVIAICEMLFLCYWANEVTIESQLVGDACYEIICTTADIKFQKAMCLIILRSQKPIVFTAGRVLPLSLMSGVASLKAVVSYFMVLRNFKNTH